MEEVLKRLKYYMKEKGYTIYKITELSELSENTVYNWYNKGAEPSLRALSSICKVLGISLSELFSNDGDKILTLREIELIRSFGELSETQKNLIIILISEFKKQEY